MGPKSAVYPPLVEVSLSVDCSVVVVVFVVVFVVGGVVGVALKIKLCFSKYSKIENEHLLKIFQKTFVRR